VKLIWTVEFSVKGAIFEFSYETTHLDSEIMKLFIKLKSFFWAMVRRYHRRARGIQVIDNFVGEATDRG
jgi:hypothetical protein